MKKIVIFFITLITIYIATEIFFAEKLNSSQLKINNKVIELPSHMYIKSIFGSNKKGNDFFSLSFGKTPSIKYPKNKTIGIIISNGKKNIFIILEPLLTKKTLYRFAENNNSKIFKNCLISEHVSKLYLIKDNYGYIIQSDDNILEKALLEQFCK